MIDLTINGLLDGISVIEKDNISNQLLRSDILFNDQEPINLKGLYFDDGFTVSEYKIEDLVESVNLIGNPEDTVFINVEQVDEYGFKLNY